MLTLTALLRDRPFTAYVTLAFSISWASWSPLTSDELSGDVGSVLFLLGGFGPLLSAVAITYIMDRSLTALRQSIFRWRFGALRWLLVLLGPLALLAGALTLYRATGGLVDPDTPPLYLYPGTLFVMILFGGLEEPGWRGVALPHLQAEFSPVTASAILGVIWAGWHTPLLFVPGTSQAGLPIAIFLGSIVVTSFLLTWIFNETGGSVLAAILFHAGLNAASAWLPTDATDASFAALVAIELLAVVIIIIARRCGPAVTPDAERTTV